MPIRHKFFAFGAGFAEKCTRKNPLTGQQVLLWSPGMGECLLFGTALPQQRLHLGKLIRSDILPLQQRRK